MMDLKVGQEVYVVGIGNNARYEVPTSKAVVTKIGRKWFHITTEITKLDTEKFSLEDGKCDGRGYMPEWRVFLTEEVYQQSINTPLIVRYIESKLKSLSYKDLIEVQKLILSKISNEIQN